MKTLANGPEIHRAAAASAMLVSAITNDPQLFAMAIQDAMVHALTLEYQPSYQADLANLSKLANYVEDVFTYVPPGCVE